MKSRTISIVLTGAVLICAINVASAFATDNHAVAELRLDDQMARGYHKTQALDIARVSEVVLDTLLYQDWESGQGNWWVDNGLWEVGMPTVGPDNTHSGENCAGTVLGGNYSSDANTRLISPQITLPSLPPGERIRLKFWHWFRIEDGYDNGYIQISVNGGNWHTIAGPYTGISPVWTQVYIDLSAYAGSTVRMAFYFISDFAGEDNGWYVDDIVIIKGPPAPFNSPEDFEQGIDDWWADNGLWEVGIPTVGPDNTHSGENCAGTVLGGNYSSDANTRLISPKITLTPAPSSEPELYFWHWYRIEDGYDNGYIQISVNGGNWNTIGGPYTGISPIWSQVYINLSAYAGSTVRIAFYFISDFAGEDNGWYVDDVRIEGINGVCVPAPGANVAKSFVLCQNHPNPFRPTTEIRYTLARDCDVKLEVFNSLGQKVATLVDQNENAGYKSVRWDASSYSAGIYFYRLQAGDFVDMKKMVIMK